MADEEQDQSSKTEDPTQHKLDESRRRGQVPLSREVNTWILLLASTFVVTNMGDDIARSLTVHLRYYLEFAHSMPTGPGGIATVLMDSFVVTFSDIFIAFIVLIILSLAFLLRNKIKLSCNKIVFDFINKYSSLDQSNIISIIKSFINIDPKCRNFKSE